MKVGVESKLRKFSRAEPGKPRKGSRLRAMLRRAKEIRDAEIEADLDSFATLPSRFPLPSRLCRASRHEAGLAFNI